MKSINRITTLFLLSLSMIGGITNYLITKPHHQVSNYQHDLKIVENSSTNNNSSNLGAYNSASAGWTPAELNFNLVTSAFWAYCDALSSYNTYSTAYHTWTSTAPLANSDILSYQKNLDSYSLGEGNSQEGHSNLDFFSLAPSTWKPVYLPGIKNLTINNSSSKPETMKYFQFFQARKTTGSGNNIKTEITDSYKNLIQNNFMSVLGEICSKISKDKYSDPQLSELTATFSDDTANTTNDSLDPNNEYTFPEIRIYANYGSTKTMLSSEFQTKIILLGLEKYFGQTMIHDRDEYTKNSIDSDTTLGDPKATKTKILKQVLENNAQLNATLYSRLLNAPMFPTEDFLSYFANSIQIPNTIQNYNPAIENPDGADQVPADDLKNKVSDYQYSYELPFFSKFVDNVLDRSEIVNAFSDTINDTTTLNRVNAWYWMEKSYLNYYDDTQKNDPTGKKYYTSPYGFAYDFILNNQSFNDLTIGNINTKIATRMVEYFNFRTQYLVNNGGDYLCKLQKQNKTQGEQTPHSDPSTLYQKLSSLNEEYPDIYTNPQNNQTPPPESDSQTMLDASNNFSLFILGGTAHNQNPNNSPNPAQGIEDFITSVANYNAGDIPTFIKKYNFWSHWYSMFIYIGIPVVVVSGGLFYLSYRFKIVQKTKNLVELKKIKLKTKKVQKERKIKEQEEDF